MTSVTAGETLGAATDPLPEPGRYRHFKGGEYELLSVGTHTETGERLAVYCSIDEPARIWVRPVEMFVEPVERPDGTQMRFARAEDGGPTRRQRPVAAAVREVSAVATGLRARLAAGRDRLGRRPRLRWARSDAHGRTTLKA